MLDAETGKEIRRFTGVDTKASLLYIDGLLVAGGFDTLRGVQPENRLADSSIGSRLSGPHITQVMSQTSTAKFEYQNGSLVTGFRLKPLRPANDRASQAPTGKGSQ